jgi:hypothetical protein
MIDDVSGNGLPGWIVSLMAIEMRLDFVSQVAPRGPADGWLGDGTKDHNEVFGGLVGEGLYSLWPAAIEGLVDGGERSAQLDVALVGLGEGVAALLLVFAQLDDPLFHGVLGLDGLLEPPLL